MTICAHHKGVLYADHAFIYNAGQVNYMSTGKKLFVSPSQRMAFAVTGMAIEPNMVETVTTILEAIVERHERTGSYTVDPGDLDTLKIKDRHYLALTKKGLYTYSKEGGGISQHSETLANGSGSPAFVALVNTGMPMPKIFETIARLSITVSKTYDSIAAKSLKAFPKVPA